MTNFCSVDLAISCTGVSIFKKEKPFKTNHLLHYTKIHTDIGQIKKESEEIRIAYICDKIIELCYNFKCKELVLEDQFINAITSKKTAMQLSRVRGALVYALTKNNIKVIYRNNKKIKKEICEIAGIDSDGQAKGNAKEIIYKAIMEIYKNNEYVLKLGPLNNKSNKSKNSDIYDSIALGTIYSYE